MPDFSNLDPQGFRDELDKLQQLPLRTGDWFGAAQEPSSYTVEDGRMQLTPLLMPGTVTLDRIAIRVTTAGAAGSTVTLALYAPDFSLIVESTAMAADTTGAKIDTINETIDYPWVWGACLALDGDVEVRGVQKVAGQLRQVDVTTENFFAFQQVSLSSIPDPVTPDSDGQNSPHVLLRVA